MPAPIRSLRRHSQGTWRKTFAFQRLMLTLDQAAKLGQESGVVGVELAGRWLTGLRSESKSGQQVTVGVLADEPMVRSARTAVTELIGTIGA